MYDRWDDLPDAREWLTNQAESRRPGTEYGGQNLERGKWKGEYFKTISEGRNQGAIQLRWANGPRLRTKTVEYSASELASDAGGVADGHLHRSARSVLRDAGATEVSKSTDDGIAACN